MKKLFCFLSFLLFPFNVGFCADSTNVESGGIILDIISFFVALIKFLIFVLKTCLNLVYKAFTYIFSNELFEGISNTFTNLAVYMGVPSAVAFMGLFVLAFLLIFLSFIFKVIKGQVNYKANVKKFTYHDDSEDKK